MALIVSISKLQHGSVMELLSVVQVYWQRFECKSLCFIQARQKNLFLPIGLLTQSLRH